MSRPFLWGWLFAALAALTFLILLKGSRARPAILCAFGVAVAMFFGEAAAAVHNARRSAKGHLVSEYSPPSITNYDHELGFALKPEARVVHTRKWADSTIFRVTYTTTDPGVRKTRGNARGDTWLFMGCSFTFGEGVEDDETLPARFSEQLGWKANVVNLAFSGYGPHQMLRMLETGRLSGAGRPVKQVIYQAIPHHVTRVAGRAWFDLEGPSYKISGDSIRYAGPFHSRAWIRARKIVLKSDLVKILNARYRLPSDAEIELYGRIVEKAAALSQEKLGAPFTILFWDDDANPTAKRVLNRLVATKLPLIRTTSFLTRRELDSLQIPHDHHPTPEVYQRLAVGLAAHFGETSKAR